MGISRGGGCLGRQRASLERMRLTWLGPEGRDEEKQESILAGSQVGQGLTEEGLVPSARAGLSDARGCGSLPSETLFFSLPCSHPGSPEHRLLVDVR